MTPGQDSNLEIENVSKKASRQSWVRLIQKDVYEVDPRESESKIVLAPKKEAGSVPQSQIG